MGAIYKNHSMAGQGTCIVWFRRDLRLSDNPALSAALAQYQSVIPLYIWAPEEEQPWEMGGASKWWLHHSLTAHAEAIKALGSSLVIRRGNSLKVLQQLVKECDVKAIFWNRLYEPSTIARDSKIKTKLKEQGIETHSFNSGLLFEPWEIKNSSSKPYLVYTPFSRNVFAAYENKKPLAAPASLPKVSKLLSDSIDSLQLLPKINWHLGFEKRWNPGEQGAKAVVSGFIKNSLADYGEQRDFPELDKISSLSPYLHFGELGPNQVWYLATSYAEKSKNINQKQLLAFLRQLIWRDFAHHLLFHFPHTDTKPLREGFSKFPWKKNKKLLLAWQQGQTGFPIVDAGMRELWQTGFMHNRVRMIAASFLIKDLLIHWKEGADWFWDTLVDADLANNTMGWQWTAGSGADAAPYFRIFNPTLQSERFDKQGSYIKTWIPELKDLPNKWIHTPALAPADVLAQAGVVLGKTYPRPIVDHAEARDFALEAYKKLRQT
jgi:deoxyribodipyrimidine photo-lyase